MNVTAMKRGTATSNHYYKLLTLKKMRDGSNKKGFAFPIAIGTVGFSQRMIDY